MSAIITAISLFLLVSLAVVFGVSLINIFSKSFRPQQSVGIIAGLLAVFAFGSLMFLISVNTFAQQLDRGVIQFDNPSAF